MLAPEEFTVGTFASAPAGSLILPRNKYEATVIVGLLDEAPTAVFLGDRFQFHCFPTAGSENWSGLIIPNVRVEVDESTAFDPAYGNSPLGTVVRAASQLSVYAKDGTIFWPASSGAAGVKPASYLRRRRRIHEMAGRAWGWP